MSERDRVSFSGVMVVLWIRNLSLHLVANGGSSFMACSMTSSPPQIVNKAVRDTWHVSAKHTTHLEPQRSDQAPPDLNSVLHSTAKDRCRVDKRLRVGCKEPGSRDKPWEL